jgi:deoxyribodipyrimidine photo-lyase
LLQIVWLKRDIRLQDHAPLAAAMATGLPVMLLYVFEPSLMCAPDYDPRHARFVWQSLQDLQKQLAGRTQMLVLQGEVTDIMQTICMEQPIQCLYSHMETGNALSHARDKAVARWCRQRGIAWQQWGDRGIIRGLQQRDNWPKQWYAYMYAPQVSLNPANFMAANLPQFSNTVHSFTDLFPGEAEKHPAMQPGGTAKGLLYLDSFLQERSINYQKHISKPDLARTGCSRLSPYLAYGCLSVRQVYQATKDKIENTPQRKNPLTTFLDRLRWHSHFMQKLESRPELEWENTNPGFNNIRTTSDDALLEAWMEGQTGFPLIDASMRCLKETGYLNFRMRAMIVSFLTHHLWQPWQSGVHHLARYFLDYEPGIHYPQFQMQAGVTGINTIRIYNPVKQAQDHDPQGLFVKKWLPEMENIPLPLLHQPWLMTQFEQQSYGCKIGIEYPEPVTDLSTAAEHARKQLWQWKNKPDVKKHNAAILKGLSGRKTEEENGV